MSHIQNRKRRDPDIAALEVALKRAARRVREVARKTGAVIVYIKDGKIVEERPQASNQDQP